MPDFMEDLRRYADAAAATVPEMELRDLPRRGDRRRQRIVVAIAAALVAIAGATVAVVDPFDDAPNVITTDPATPITAPGTTTRETASATTIAEQSSLRAFPVIAVTRTEILVWAGEAGSEAAVRADGFAIDIVSGAVREIPPAPIVARSGATGVWTGSELIVCCGTGQPDGYGRDTRSAAAWDPVSGAWRTLAPPPEAVARSYPAAVWTGTQMVVVATGPAAAAYDPTTDTWHEIAPPPIRGREPAAAWTGTEVIVWDPVYGTASFPPSGSVEDRSWRWAPGDDDWTELPELPTGSRTRLGSMAWTGTDLVVWGLSTADDALGVGARWRPGDATWSPIEPSPQGPVPDPYDGTPGSQALAVVGGRVLVKGIDGGQAGGDDGATDALMLYDPATDRWTTTTLTVWGYSPDIVVADGRVLVPDREQPLVGTLP